MKSDSVFGTKIVPSIRANFLWVFGNEWMRLVQCSKLKNIPGCPYFKSRATKAVNLVALMNPWLPGRKTHTFKSSALLKKHPFLSS